MEYRLYLLDAERHIVATHGFIASGDISARETGSIVFDACEDVLAGRSDGLDLEGRTRGGEALLRGEAHQGLAGAGVLPSRSDCAKKRTACRISAGWRLGSSLKPTAT